MVKFFFFFLAGVLTSGMSSLVTPNSEYSIPSNSLESLENLVDSRFKQLAVGFQDQLNGLNDKVKILEEANKKNTNHQDNHLRGIMKRQTFGSKKTYKSVCESSSSLCTFYHPDHPDASRKQDSYNPSITTEILQDANQPKEMPTSCEALQELGHKLNGFYLIKTARPNQGSQIETVFCDFQSSTRLETELGSVDVKSASVQFYVERTGDWGGNNGQKLEFGKETLNVGNGFDWSNQWFRAPFSGTYFFSISGSGRHNKGQKISIKAYLNDKQEFIGEALSSEDTHYGSYSYQFTKTLNAGDKIVLYLETGTIYLAYFSGWMIEQDLGMI